MKYLQKSDPDVYRIIKNEEKRQRDVLEMIPSENYTSAASLEALGSVLNNKYSEGYPKKRYYQGNEFADEVEILAQERARKLFGVPFVNVQALSGSPANLAVYTALLEPLKGKIMGLSLAFGGHLTHGQPQSATGRFFKSSLYTLNRYGYLDYKEIEKKVLAEKPDILVCGFTAYPRQIDFAAFGRIADKAGCFLLADISHIAGLVVSGVHPSPVNYAHIVTTTTHKTLRGPRGALIMVTEKGLKKDPDLGKKIDSAIIPGLQGGPHDNQTAAIAVCLKEAASTSFKKYSRQIITNAKTLSDALLQNGFEVVSGGTDNHLLLLDLRKAINGAVFALALEKAGIVVNKNAVPFDTLPPFYPGGIRLGTPAITTRGLLAKDMPKIASWMHRTLLEAKDLTLSTDKTQRSLDWKKAKKAITENKNLQKIAYEVKSFLTAYPLP